MYKKILVPHDGSEYSERAADRAIELARLSGAKVVFVNSTVLPSFIYTYKEAANAAINEAAEELMEFSGEVATKILGDLVSRCRKKGIAASFVHKVGDPAEVILAAAKAEGADLIVIGSKGLSGLSRLRALGSVARKVSEHSRCPVLIVH